MPDSRPGSRRRRRSDGGRRCVVMNCNNCSSEYSLYSVRTVKDPSIREQWYRFIETKRKDFTRRDAVTVYVCDGHFMDKHFNQSQLLQYNMKCRSIAPELSDTAVPVFHTATRPHFPKLPPEETTTPATLTRTEVGLEVDSPAKRKRSRYQRDKEIKEIMDEEEKRSKSVCTETDTSSENNEEMDVTISDQSEPSLFATPSQQQPLPLQPEPQLQPLIGQQVVVMPRKLFSTGQYNPASVASSGSSQAPLPVPPRPIMKDKILQVTTKPKRKPYKSRATQVGPSFVSPQQASCQTCGCQCRVGENAAKKPTTANVTVELSDQLSSNVKAQPAKPQVQISELSSEEDFEEEEEEEEEEDNVDLDPDWTPAEDEWPPDCDEDDGFVEEAYVPKEQLAQDAVKYTVFEEQLMELFSTCPLCQGPCAVTRHQPKSFGSLLKVTQRCLHCNHQRQWESQPRVGDVPAGNLLLSAAVLFAGASPSKFMTVLKHLKLKGISVRTFHNHQARYLQPSIVRTWESHQQKVLTRLRAIGEPLILAGDGRADSPGFCAKYGLYSLMDMQTCQIIHIELVQSTEVKNSCHMEMEGLIRSLKFLKDQGLTVATLITDRHGQIGKFMREKHPEIDHRFDVWHIAKGVKKKLLAAGKTTGFEDINDWRKAIVNHLYWSATSTTDGDGEVMMAKFYSLTNHIIHKHVHDEHPQVSTCQHGEISPREWMKDDSKSYDKICSIVKSPYLSTGLKQMSPLEQTSKLEGFHSLLCFWAPKLLAFSSPGMICRSYLACMHWNENGDREQATKADGTLQYKLTFPRVREHEATVKRVMKPCTYGYVDVLMRGTMAMAKRREKNARNNIVVLQHKPALCADYERPDKDVAIQEHLRHSRYGNRGN